MVSLSERYEKCTKNAHILKVYNFRKLLITCKGNMIGSMNGFKRKVIKLSHWVFPPLTHGGFKRRVIHYKSASELSIWYPKDSSSVSLICCKTLCVTHTMYNSILWKWQQGASTKKSLFPLSGSLDVWIGMHSLKACVWCRHTFFIAMGFLFTMVRRISKIQFWFWLAWFNLAF